MKRFFHLLFAPCEGIAELISESLDRPLTRTEGFAVRLHMLYCRACRRFRIQIRRIREAIGQADPSVLTSPRLTLRAEAKSRIIDALGSR